MEISFVKNKLCAEISFSSILGYKEIKRKKSCDSEYCQWNGTIVNLSNVQ